VENKEVYGLVIENLAKLDNEDLRKANRHIGDLLKANNLRTGIAIKAILYDGCPVYVTSNGKKEKGTVEKIMNTRATVVIDGKPWDVPLNMISIRKE